MAPAFIVDGLTEKKIIQRLCQGTTVRMTQLNGRDVALAAIAKAVHSLINLFKGRHFPIVIVVDREGREIAAEQLEKELSDLLGNLGVDTSQLIVCCPDRMIENWMLGDADYFKQIHDVKLEENYEGTNGKSEIRKILRLKGIAYNETSVGVEIFTKIDPRNVAQSTRSFASFKARVENFCFWLRR